eukprot:2252224-Rhodomonas_salina.1
MRHTWTDRERGAPARCSGRKGRDRDRDLWREQPQAHTQRAVLTRVCVWQRDAGLPAARDGGGPGARQDSRHL